ncbi:MAG: hypothetical protein WC415_06450 [Patescibacteria group bacterium]|jgi:hypothetical protein
MPEQNLIKISEIVKDFSNIQINSYIPFIIKKNMIDNILDICISIDVDGFKRVDPATKIMATEFSICNQATNIDLSEEVSLTAYDELKKSGAIKYIMNNIDVDEISFIKNCIDEKIKEIYIVDNSFQGVVSKTLNKLIEKIPDSKEINKLIPKIGKELSKISPETLELLKNINNK